MNFKLTGNKLVIKELASQRRWIDDHGGDLAGYVQRYGSKNDARHCGDGGEAIYAADMAQLRKLEAWARFRSR